MKRSRRLYPSITALRAIEALDRLGSASAVAEELSLTQSAVTRQLQSLEAQTGADLIRRDRRNLSLSQPARAYVAEIRDALNRISQASLRLQAAPGGGTVNLAILPTFGMRWLVPRLPEFTRLHPEITLNMTSRLKRFSFDLEPFDAALHFGVADWPGTDRLKLRNEQVLPVCAPDLLPAGAVAGAADLLRMPLLHIQTRPQAWSEWFAAMGVDCPAPLPGMMHDQFATIGQAAHHGLGVALMPSYLVEQDLATGRLVAAFAEPVETVGAYWLVWPISRSDDPALRAFRGWLASQAEAEDSLPR